MRKHLPELEERFTVEVMTDTIEGILERAAGAKHG
jgi:hypothetical protein